MSRSLRGLPAALLLLAAAPASAQFHHPRSVPLGGRTATMGGAATAAGNDSAMPYLNPAGLAGLPGDVFGVSASLYGWSRRTFDSLFSPDGYLDLYQPVKTERETIDSSSLTDLPSSVMYVRPLPSSPGFRHAAALALVVPARQRTEIIGSTRVSLGAAQGFDENAVSVSMGDTDYYIGPSYAVALGERLRLGVSLFALYAESFATREYSSFSALANGTSISTAAQTRADEAAALAVVPVVGAQLRTVGSLWLGAAVAAPSLHLWGEDSATRHAELNTPSTTPSGVTILRESGVYAGERVAGRPLRANFGLAWDDRRGVSAAADVHLYLARDAAESSDGRERVTSFNNGELPRRFTERLKEERDLVAAAGFSAGAELTVAPGLALRTGGFADFANVPEFVRPTSGLYRIREDRFGGTLGLGATFGSFDSTVGVVFTHATGDIVALDVNSERSFRPGASPLSTTPTREDSLLFVLSGAITAEEARRQIEEATPLSLPLPE